MKEVAKVPNHPFYLTFSRNLLLILAFVGMKSKARALEVPHLIHRHEEIKTELMKDRSEIRLLSVWQILNSRYGSR
jgi:hypothetical protein